MAQNPVLWFPRCMVLAWPSRPGKWFLIIRVIIRVLGSRHDILL